MALRDSIFSEAEHDEKIKLVQKSLDINGAVMNGSLRIMRLICKHIPNLIKPRITGAPGPCHRLPPGFL